VAAFWWTSIPRASPGSKQRDTCQRERLSVATATTATAAILTALPNTFTLSSCPPYPDPQWRLAVSRVVQQPPNCDQYPGNGCAYNLLADVGLIRSLRSSRLCESPVFPLRTEVQWQAWVQTLTRQSLGVRCFSSVISCRKAAKIAKELPTQGGR